MPRKPIDAGKTPLVESWSGNIRPQKVISAKKGCPEGSGSLCQ